MNAKSFVKSRVSDSSKERWGNRLMREMQKCDDYSTGNELLTVAYWHKVPNYHEIEDLFWSKFPNASHNDKS